METPEECAHVQIKAQVFFEHAFGAALPQTGHSNQYVCQAALRVHLWKKGCCN